MSGPLVLERRGAAARWLSRRWRAWETSAPGWASFLERLTGTVARRVLARRLASRGAPPPDRLVVSIGNLRVGGTGKTPVALDLVRRLAENGRAGCILTRGYGSANRGPILVDPVDASCGDEARLLARDGGWPVVQAADRAAGYDLALATTSPGGVIVVEDGHQSAGVPRHRDLLILDRWTDVAEGVAPAVGRTLPGGPYREDAAGAERADALLLALADAAPCPELVEAGGRTVLAFRRRTVIPEEARDWDSYGVVSGIAAPESFEAACAAALGRPPAAVARYDDHAAYRAADAAAVAALGREAGVAGWLTTAKDSVKLVPLWSAATPLREADLALDWAGRTPADLVEDWLEERGTP